MVQLRSGYGLLHLWSVLRAVVLLYRNLAAERLCGRSVGVDSLHADRRILGQKKILRANSSKDCTLFHFILSKTSPGAFHTSGNLPNLQGRSSDSRINLLSEPSRFKKRNSGVFGFRPRSQRRDRSRITRDSLLSLMRLKIL